MGGPKCFGQRRRHIFVCDNHQWMYKKKICGEHYQKCETAKNENMLGMCVQNRLLMLLQNSLENLKPM